MRNNAINWSAYVSLSRQPEVRSDLLDDPLPSELVDKATVAAQIEDLYENGYKPGISTGWPKLDEWFTVRRGEFTVVTGIPNHGKSSWVDNLMVNLSENENWKWAVFSAENLPAARYVSGLIEIRKRLPFRFGPTPRMNHDQFREGFDWIMDHFQFIQPREDRYSLDRIVQIASSLENINGLVIDPWNEMDISRPRDMREDEFISNSLTKLRWLARSSDIHILVVAHPAKYHRIPGQPKPIITLNDVKGASEWYAKADNGISVWRDEQDSACRTDIHVQKVRFREVGKAGGAVSLYYDRVTGRYY